MVLLITETFYITLVLIYLVVPKSHQYLGMMIGRVHLHFRLTKLEKKQEPSTFLV